MEEKIKIGNILYVWECSEIKKYKVVTPLENVNPKGKPCYKFKVSNDNGDISDMMFKPNASGVDWDAKIHRGRSFDIDKLKKFLSKTFTTYVRICQTEINRQNGLIMLYNMFNKYLKDF